MVDPTRTKTLKATSHLVLRGELLKKEMQFERDFVKAGGLLLSGEDPTGYGGVLAGFGDQRQTELLVAAGFNKKFLPPARSHK